MVAMLSWLLPPVPISMGDEPASPSLSVWADPDSVEAGGSTTIYAQLVDTATNPPTPIPGATVNFGASNGSLSAGSAATDENGVCFVGFSGSGSDAEISAADAMNYGTSASCIVSVSSPPPEEPPPESPPPSSASLSVWADPNSISEGGSTVIRAQLVDTATSPPTPVSGAVINFSTPAGDGTLSTASALTNEYGICEIGFQAGSGSAQVNAWDGMGYGTSSSCVVQVQGITTPSYSLWIGADNNPLQLGQPTTLRVQLTEAGSNAPVGGATIYFEVSSGNASLGALSATTDAEGLCSVPVSAGSASSQINAWDVSGYNTSNGLTLMVPSLSNNLSLTLSADQNPLPPGAGTILTAEVRDTSIDFPLSGVTLNLSLASENGALLNGVSYGAHTLSTGEDGRASISFQGGPNPAEVRAEDGHGLGLTANLTMGVQTEQYSLSLWPEHSTLEPGNITTLTAQLQDSTNNAPVSDATVSFAVNPGAGDGLLSADGTNWSESVSVSTNSEGLCAVYFMGGYLTTTVSTADGGGCGTFAEHTFGVVTTNATRNLDLWTDDNVVLMGDSAVLHAQLWDIATGLPVSGAAVEVQIVGGDGTLGTGAPGMQASVTAYTDGSGNCEVFFTGGSGASEVSASAEGLAAPVSHWFEVAAESYAVEFTPSATSLAPGSTTSVNVQVRNTTRDLLMTGVPLAFSIYPGDGGLDVISGTTDPNGDCWVTFTGGSMPSTLQASCANGWASGTCEFQVAGGYVLTMSSDQSMLIPGHSTTIHALLMDHSTQPPTPMGGVPINFIASADGSVEGTAWTDSGGACSVNFTGGSSPTTVWANDANGLGTSAHCNFGVSNDDGGGGGGDEGGGEGGGSGGGGGGTVTYSLEPLSPEHPWLDPGYLTTVSTTLRENGTGAAIEGASIAFTIRSGDGYLVGNGGYTTSTSATTDASGVATVTFSFGYETTVVDAATNTTYNATGSYTFQAPNVPPPPWCSCLQNECQGVSCGDNCGCSPPPQCDCVDNDCLGGGCGPGVMCGCLPPQCPCFDGECGGTGACGPADCGCVPPICPCNGIDCIDPATCVCGGAPGSEICQDDPRPPPTCPGCSRTGDGCPGEGCDCGGNGTCVPGSPPFLWIVHVDLARGEIILRAQSDGIDADVYVIGNQNPNQISLGHVVVGPNSTTVLINWGAFPQTGGQRFDATRVEARYSVAGEARTSTYAVNFTGWGEFRISKYVTPDDAQWNGGMTTVATDAQGTATVQVHTNWITRVRGQEGIGMYNGNIYAIRTLPPAAQQGGLTFYLRAQAEGAYVPRLTNNQSLAKYVHGAVSDDRFGRLQTIALSTEPNNNFFYIEDTGPFAGAAEPGRPHPSHLDRFGGVVGWQDPNVDYPRSYVISLPQN